MDKPLSVQQNKTTKTSKKSKNKKPLKVVYISNPRRVKATPSEFRALVQELTGKDAIVPEPHHFAAHVAGDYDVEDFSSEVLNVELLESDQRVKRSDQEFASCNDDFFSRFLESSGLLYESYPVDHLLTSLDVV